MCRRVAVALLAGVLLSPAVANAATPNDPLFGDQWGAFNSGQAVRGLAGVAGVDAGLTGAWDVVTGGPTVVAVAGSGVAMGHPDLAANIWSNPGETGTDAQGRDKGSNGIDDDGNGRVDDRRGWDFVSDDNDPTDLNGSGTQLAGLVGAVGNNGTGIAGASWNVRLMPLRVGASSPTDNSVNVDALASAMLYASAKGAKVFVTSSVGTTAQTGLDDAIAASPNMLFVFAAGGDGTDVDATPRYPCALNRPNVICTTAITSQGALPGWANRGSKNVDLAAPGGQVLSTTAVLVKQDEPFEEPIAGRWTPVGPDAGWGVSTSPRADGTKALTINGNTSPVASGSSSAIAGPRVDLAGCTAPYLRITATAAYSNGLFEIWATDDPNRETFASWVKLGTLGNDGQSQELVYDLATMPAAPGKNFTGKTVAVVLTSLTGAGETGRGPVVDELSLICAPNVYTGQEYDYLLGTGAAAATVAGTAALVASQYPAGDVNYLRNALLGAVTPTPSLSGKTVTGGRLNAAAAIDSVPPAAFAATGPADGATTTDTRPTFTFAGTTDDKTGISRYELVVDGQLAGTVDGAGRAILPVTPLAIARHSWQVVAVDGAGLRTATPARTIDVVSPAVPRDTTSPTLTLGKLAKTTRRRIAKSGFSLSCRLSEPGSCAAELRVSRADARKLRIGKTAKTLLLAKATKKTAGNGRATLTLKPSAKIRKALGKARRKVTYRFTVTAKDAAGNPAKTRTVTQRI